MYSLGIDIGYSTVKIVVIDEAMTIVLSAYEFHKGQLKETLLLILERMEQSVSLTEIVFSSVTGSGSIYIQDRYPINKINDITALVEGAKQIYPEVNSIVEIGGQSAAYITNIHSVKGELQFALNTGCSAGTGSFLEEQVNRLNLDIHDYSRIASKASDVPRIAGRCSVFAKTDIIHHQQDGVRVEDILQGLARAVAKNYKAMIVQNYLIKAPVLFVGGVSLNDAMFEEISSALKITDTQLMKCENREVVSAIGTAKMAMLEKNIVNMTDLIDAIKNDGPSTHKEAFIISKNQPLNTFGEEDSINKHLVYPDDHKNYGYLGIDIGSTSTNLVVIDNDNKVMWYQYLRTNGNPINAVEEGLKQLVEDFGGAFIIKGVCTTGSGRALIGKRLNVDLIKDEITAQAKATMTLAPDIDTIFEIGGQDSKFIQIEQGRVKDFQMNKVCAAGTGAFIEEQANKLSMSLEEFTAAAIKSHQPLDLGERCTVFIEASIMEQLTKGAEKEDIAAGLCYSIVRNFLNKVVGHKKIGEKIAIQGGIAYNQGVVNAFRALTGKGVIVLPYFSVTGAFGAATLANEVKKNRTVEELMILLKQENEVTIKTRVDNKDTELEDLFLANYTGLKEAGKKTVGIPRVMFLHKLFPVFNTFFQELGYNTILTDQTDEELVELSSQYALSDACYPIKLVHGHVAKLIELNVDYIFLPSLETMKHEASSSRCNYGCVYMQNLSRIVESNIGIEEAGIKLLAPTLSFQLGKKHMMQSMIRLGKELGKNPASTLLAMKKGMRHLGNYIKATEKKGQTLVNSLKPDERAFVIVTRAYGINDPVLNMNVPNILEGMGHKVLTLSQLPAHDVDLSLEHENMYWPFGQHMISGAQIIKEHPNLYAIYLTNHGCGPDTIISKYFEEAMGEKPFLHLEVDEHASAVGVKTRIEAFINSIEGNSKRTRSMLVSEGIDEMETYVKKVTHAPVSIEYKWEALFGDETLVLPNIYPYSQLFKGILSKEGVKCDLLPVTSAKSLEKGLHYTITKEAHSLTGLIGDVLTYLETSELSTPSKLLIPTNEGTEVQGQYNRVLRSIMDKNNHENIKIIAPFLEDLIYDDEMGTAILWGVLAGDLIMLAPPKDRGRLLETLLKEYSQNNARLIYLEELSLEISRSCSEETYDKYIMAVGEPLIIHNEYLHHFMLDGLEREGHRIIRNPLSERVMHMWRHHINRGHRPNANNGKKQLKRFDSVIGRIHENLSTYSPFSKELDSLEKEYTLAKMTNEKPLWDGMIHLSSMYENTHTVVKMLRGNDVSDQRVPVLDMGVEKLMNEQSKLALSSFVYFLKGQVNS